MLPNKKLSKNATLKQINRYKRQLNFGDMPGFYHMIATSVADIEGQQRHGFDSALNRLLNTRNWNMQALGDPDTPEGKPRIALYQVFTEQGFEVHCFPYLQDKLTDDYHVDHPMMEFKRWDPSHMRRLISVPQLEKFIEITFSSGDKADFALLAYATRAVNRLMRVLQHELRVVKIGGVSIQGYVESVIKQIGHIDPNALPPQAQRRMGTEALYRLKIAHRKHLEEEERKQQAAEEARAAQEDQETKENTGESPTGEA